MLKQLARVFAAGLMAVPMLASPAGNERARDGKAIVQPAIDGLFDAFKTHPLVGIGDAHGLAVQAAFYAELISDPRFARRVGNVVVEFGSATHQGIIDRYVSGETVPYTELRKVWADTVGWNPPAGNVGYARFFAAVRATNSKLPASRHIRVWLGEPPVDWEKATLREVMIAHSSRDAFPAELISRNILARRRKALVIYGSYHFGGGNWLRGRVDAAHPGRFFVVHPYAGHHHPQACAPMLQEAMAIWPNAALAWQPARKAAQPALLACTTFKPAADTTIAGEGILFLSALETHTNGAVFPDYVLDAPLRREMARRGAIGAMPLVRFPSNYVLRKSDYAFDLEAPGFKERIDAMFAQYDLNRDGVVTSREYRDPVPR